MILRLWYILNFVIANLLANLFMSLAYRQKENAAFCYLLGQMQGHIDLPVNDGTICVIGYEVNGKSRIIPGWLSPTDFEEFKEERKILDGWDIFYIESIQQFRSKAVQQIADIERNKSNGRA